MPFTDIAGLGALKEALSVTNERLEAVLRALEETNRERLAEVTRELGRVNDKLDALLELEQAREQA